MNPAVAEWVSKAEGDFVTAGRELRARKLPNYDAVCFHCQQCAEKYLKAVLQENDKRIPKIHFLLEPKLLPAPSPAQEFSSNTPPRTAALSLTLRCNTNCPCRF